MESLNLEAIDVDGAVHEAADEVAGAKSNFGFLAA